MATADSELVDSLTSFLQDVLAVAIRDFERDLLWKRVTDAMKMKSNIVAGDEDDDGLHSYSGFSFHHTPSVMDMNRILELSVVEDIRVSLKELTPPSIVLAFYVFCG